MVGRHPSSILHQLSWLHTSQRIYLCRKPAFLFVDIQKRATLIHLPIASALYYLLWYGNQSSGKDLSYLGHRKDWIPLMVIKYCTKWRLSDGHNFSLLYLHNYWEVTWVFLVFCWANWSVHHHKLGQRRCSLNTVVFVILNSLKKTSQKLLTLKKCALISGAQLIIFCALVPNKEIRISHLHRGHNCCFT